MGQWEELVHDLPSTCSWDIERNSCTISPALVHGTLRGTRARSPQHLFMGQWEELVHDLPSTFSWDSERNSCTISSTLAHGTVSGTCARSPKQLRTEQWVELVHDLPNSCAREQYVKSVFRRISLPSPGVATPWNSGWITYLNPRQIKFSITSWEAVFKCWPLAILGLLLTSGHREVTTDLWTARGCYLLLTVGHRGVAVVGLQHEVGGSPILLPERKPRFGGQGESWHKLHYYYNKFLFFDRLSSGQSQDNFTPRKKASMPFRIALGNVDHMHECSPEHLRMETGRMK